MAAQLDLFINTQDEETAKPMPPKKAREKALKPPEVVFEEPVEKPLPVAKTREILRKEVLKISQPSKQTAKEDSEQKISEKGKTNRGRKSIKEMSHDAQMLQLPDDASLYSKQYYGIGEVASMFSVNASLLRYWESEFDILKPRKNGKGDRFFRPDDIKNLQIIHHLLRQRKFTIEGAKEFLKNQRKAKDKFEVVKQLQHLKAFLLEMKAVLK